MSKEPETKESSKAGSEKPSSEHEPEPTDPTPSDQPTSNLRNTPSRAKSKNMPAKVAKPKKSQPTESHPPYLDMIKTAIIEQKEQKGSSRAAILKFITQHHGLDAESRSVNANLRQALNRGVRTGSLKQVSGTGASGSFRLGESPVNNAPKSAKTRGLKRTAPTTNKNAEKSTRPKRGQAKATYTDEDDSVDDIEKLESNNSKMAKGKTETASSKAKSPNKKRSIQKIEESSEQDEKVVKKVAKAPVVNKKKGGKKKKTAK
ncbi:linker histone h1 and h5 family domain-containing protein [Ditylenchus destructor]|nr:linker histone h1 and h5 family domain-containing protein [Ditylenchus destructor]